MSDANDCIEHGEGVMVYFLPPLEVCPLCRVEAKVAKMRAAIENQLSAFEEQDILETPELLVLRQALKDRRG